MGGSLGGVGTEAKLDVLAESARYDVCLSSCAGNSRGGVGRCADPSEPFRRWIYPAAVPGLGQVGILKVLQTNACRNNCSYCALAASRDCVRRVTLEPAELAGWFMRLYRAGLVHGVFVSSGVNGQADAAMARVIETAEILRKRHCFAGYVHLKVLPGCSRSAVLAAARYATRLSLNLEAPTPQGLGSIAPDKDFVRDLLLRMKWVGEAVKSGEGASSHTTQFVVGAAESRTSKSSAPWTGSTGSSTCFGRTSPLTRGLATAIRPWLARRRERRRSCASTGSTRWTSCSEATASGSRT